MHPHGKTPVRPVDARPPSSLAWRDRSRVAVSRRLAPAVVVAVSLAGLSACSMSGHGDDAHGSDVHHGSEDDHHDGAAGRPGEADRVDRVVAIGMSDAMDYTPETLAVATGETIRFDVSNDGELVHEFVLGTTEEILEHHELMLRFPGMEHEEPNSVSLKPGMSGQVIWEFGEAGEVSYACLQPGHYEAGMKGVVRVGNQP